MDAGQNPYQSPETEPEREVPWWRGRKAEDVTGWGCLTMLVGVLWCLLNAVIAWLTGNETQWILLYFGGGCLGIAVALGLWNAFVIAPEYRKR